MVIHLAAFKAPSNIEKKVLEIQDALYRRRGLATARALPPLIPLCFLSPQGSDPARGNTAGRLSEAVGRQAPFLTTGPLSEIEGCLFWTLGPQDTLEGLVRSFRERFAGRELAQSLFPVGHGFFLGCSSAQLRPLTAEAEAEAAIPPAEQPLTFPAKAAVLIRLATLAQGPAEAADWRRALFWEEILRLPLRKTPAGGGSEPGLRDQ